MESPVQARYESVGKSARQSEDVMRTEIEVGKSVSHASRKAAIVYTVPVP